MSFGARAQCPDLELLGFGYYCNEISSGTIIPASVNTYNVNITITGTGNYTIVDLNGNIPSVAVNLTGSQTNVLFGRFTNGDSHDIVIQGPGGCVTPVVTAANYTCTPTDYCETNTPYLEVDFTGLPDAILGFDGFERGSKCCGAEDNGQERCFELRITLDEMSAGLAISISGAGGFGSQYIYTLEDSDAATTCPLYCMPTDCGQGNNPVDTDCNGGTGGSSGDVSCPNNGIQESNTPICLLGGETYEIFICKPGSNEDAFEIQSIQIPSIETDTLTRLAEVGSSCPTEIVISGLDPATISITATVANPGAEALLSCTDCATPVFTPPLVAVITDFFYEACGTPPASDFTSECLSNQQICLPFFVRVIPPIEVFGLGPDIFLCLGEPVDTTLSLLMAPTGGSGPPYTIIWTLPDNSQVMGSDTFLNVTMVGEYVVEVRDNMDVPYCQPYTDTLEVIETLVACCMLTTTCASTDVTCDDDAGSADDGTVTATAMDGVGVLNYVLTPGGATNMTGIFTGLTPNTYTITVTDANSCTASCTAAVAAAAPLSLSCASTDVTCNDDAGSADDGTVTATITGGVGVLSYVLTPGGTTNATGSFTGLAPNSYTVTVTDADGCSASCTAAVAAAASLSLSCASTDVTCNDDAGSADDGTVTATITGGVGVLSYVLTPGGTTNATGSFTGLAPNSYTVTVTDADGCSASCTAAVAAAASLSLSCASTDVTCNDDAGSADDGTVTATITGGVGVLSYVLTPGGTTNATGSFTGLAPNSYTVTVTDADGCSASCTAAVAAAASLSLSCASTDVTCNDDAGSADDGTVTATITGGVGVLSYVLTPGGTTNATGSFTGLAPNSYTVTVTDADGCSASCTAAVGAAPLLSLSCASTDVTCNDDAGSADDGTVTATITGGVGVLSYVLTPGGTTNATGSFTGLAPNSYTVTVTDADGCSASCTAAVGAAPLLSLSCASTDVTCNDDAGSADDGTVTATITGGVGVLSYVLTPGGTTNATGSFSGLAPNSYTVTVTDANGDGCSASCTAAVAAAASLSLSCASTDVTCNDDAGSADDGTVTATITGGVGVLSYVLTPGGTTNATGSFTGLAPNSYTVTVTDADGCSASCTAAVAAAPLLSLSCASTDVTCNDDAGSADDGTVTATITGGVGVLSYVLTPGGTTNATGSFSGLAPNSYTVTVTDADGCSASCTAAVAAAPLLSLSCASTDVTCNDDAGSADDGTVTATITGGVGVLSYVLTPGGTTNATGSFTDLAPNSYTVTVTDADGCSASCTAAVAAAASLSLSCASTDVTCNDDAGSADDGTVTATITGGVGVLSYVLTPGGTTNATGSFTGLAPNSYTVTVTDADGCSASCTAAVAAAPLLSLSCASTDVTCNDDAGSADDGTVTATITGGVGVLSYVLTPGGTTNATGSFTGLAPNSYTVTVTDADGCSASCTAAVAAAPLLSLSCASTDVTCNDVTGSADDGTVTATITGGVGVLSYMLTPGGTTNATGSFTGLAANSYTVTVTDADGCSASCTAAVAAASSLSLSCASTDVTCNDDAGSADDGTVTATITGGAGVLSYVLTPGGTTNATGSFTGLAPNSYTVTVTDADGCSAACTAAVAAAPLLSLSCASTDVTCNDDAGSADDGTVTATITGGVGVLSYVLTPGGTTNATGSFTGLAPNSYTVMVTDADGCSASCTAAVAGAASLSLSCASTDVTCNDDAGSADDGTVTATITGGVGVLSYVLTPGGTTNATGSFTGLAPNSYTVTVTDADGCSASCTAAVAAASLLSLSCASTDVTCNDDAGSPDDGTVTATITGGVGVLSYVLTPGGTTNATGSFTGLAPNSYTVTVTDADGCSASCTAAVAAAPLLSLSCASTDVTCNDDAGSADDGTVTATITGGVGVLSYVLTPGGTTNATGSFTGLAPNSYTVTVTDADGCSASCTAAVAAAASLSLSCASTDVTCNDDAGSADDGTVTATITGGVGVLSYVLTPGGTTNATGSFTGLAPNSYTVTVTDADGCSASCTAAVAAASLLSLSCASTDVTCNDVTGSADDGTVTATISGGVGVLSYVLTPGGTTNATGSFTGLAANSYTVTVTDADGCSASCTAAVAAASLLSCTASELESVSCIDGNDGRAFVTPSGGTGAGTYTYLWTPSSQTTDTAVGLSAGGYVVTVTDANSCSTTCSVTIEEPELLEFCPEVNCDNLQGVLAEVILNITGGTSPYEVNIDNSGWRPVLNDTVMLANGGTYSVDVRDANQCDATPNCPIPVRADRDSRFTAVLVNVLCCDITCPEDAEFDCGDDDSIDAWLSSYTLIGCVGSTVMTDYDVDNFTGGCGTTGTQVVTFDVMDAQGVILASCMANLSILDTIPPVIVCPMDTLIDCTEDTTPGNLGMATATDQCDVSAVITFTDNITPGNCPQESVIMRTWVATDACQNQSTCIQTITIQDTIPPVIPMVGNVDTAYCGQFIDLVVPFVAMDACDDDVPVLNSSFIIDSLCPGTYKLVLQFDATDDCMNSTTAYDTIQFLDTLAPMLVCPMDTTLDCVADTMPSSTGMAMATDLCSGPVIITYDDVVTVGDCPQEFVVSRTWTATDQCGNDTMCVQLITVQDTTAPVVVTCPADIAVSCTAPTDTASLGSATFMDVCSDVVEVTFRDDLEGFDGTCTNQVLGTITRTFFGEDQCGNIDSSCVQVITVEDVIPPDITFVGELIVGLNSGDTVRYQCFGQDQNWGLPPMGVDDVMATDSCDQDVEVTFEDIVESDGDCATDGYFRRFRCSWTATDDCGNSSTAFIIFDIVDTIPPQIIGVPRDMIVSCDALPDTSGVETFDECLCSHLAFEEQLVSDEACASDEILLRIWTASDHCGNVTIDTQRLYLIDELGPEFDPVHPNLLGLSNGDILEFDCNEGGFPDWLDEIEESSVEAIDACSDLGEHWFKRYSGNGHCGNDGYMERILFKWHAEDACGNEAGFLVEAWLVDLRPPVFLEYADDICTSDPREIEPFVYDECSSNYFLEYEDIVLGRSNCGDEIMRIYTAWDVCGNEALDTIMIHNVDNAPPQIIGRNPLLDGEEIQLECRAAEGDNISGMSEDDVQFADNCADDLDIEFTEEVIGENPCDSEDGLYVLSLTWTAEDNCGNITELSIVAHVFDNTPPMANLPDTTYYECGDELPEVEVIDNCGLAASSVDEIVSPGSCVGEEIRTYRVIGVDFCGNGMAKDIVMIIRDSRGPRFLAEEIVCDNTYSPISSAYDRCTEQYVPAVLIDMKEEECEGTVIITRVYEATDDCGNTSRFEQLHFTGDIPSPEIEISDPWLASILEQGNLIQIDFSSVWYDRVQAIDGQEIFAPNRCFLGAVSFTKDVEVLDDCRSDGVREVITFRWEIVGVCGSDESITLTFEVRDDVAPQIIEPVDETIYCGSIPAIPSLTATDNYPGSIDQVYNERTERTSNGSIIVRYWRFTDTCGNATEMEQIITMIDDPGLSCQIIPESAVIACNSHNNLFVGRVTGSDGPYRYEWRITEGDCFITAGQGTPSILVYVGFLDVHLELIVTDRYGCTTVCTFEVDCQEKEESLIDQNGERVEGLSPSIDMEYDREIKTWPNPVYNQLSIQIESKTSHEGQVEIYDALGRKVYNQSILTNKEARIQANWPEGLYIIRYTEQGYERIKHFIKSDLQYQP